MVPILTNWMYRVSPVRAEVPQSDRPYGPSPMGGFFGDWSGLPIVGDAKDKIIADADVHSIAWPVVRTRFGFEFVVVGPPRVRVADTVAEYPVDPEPGPMALTLVEWGVGKDDGPPDVSGWIRELPRSSWVRWSGADIASIRGRVMTLRDGTAVTLGESLKEREDNWEKEFGWRYHPKAPIVRCAVCGQITIRGLLPSIECREHKISVINGGGVWGR